MNILKIRIVKAVVTILTLLSITSLETAPFINIDRIDADSEFPNMKVSISLSNIYRLKNIEFSEENLTLFEDNYRVNYVRLLKQKKTEKYLYLVLSIDTSKSIDKVFLKKIKSAAINIVNRAGPGDKIAMYRFNNEVKRLNTFISSKAALIDNVKNIGLHGNKTMLYNAVYDSLELLEKIESGRKGVIIFTDGKDEGSSVKADDIIKYSRDTGLPVNFVCMKSSKNISSLARISRLTGGKQLYIDDIEKINELYEKLASPRKNRYLVQYRTMMKKDDKEHSLEIKFKHGRIRDSETKKFKIKSKMGGISFIKDPYIFHLLLISIIVCILIITLVFFIRRENKLIAIINETDKKMPRIITTQTMDKNAGNIPIVSGDNVILTDDPEYSYSDAWLVQKNGPEPGKKFPIYFKEITLGRSNECSIFIDDETVSLNHSKIKNIKDIYYLFDLVSDNGTFLNGKKLLRPRAIYDWDEIKLGKTTFLFRGSKTADS